MKYLIATDIHGSATSAEIILQKQKEFGADKIILLGDVLYHGPRNDLPENYNPKKVVELLNSVANNIIAVRGNCDAEVDQMVLEFELKESHEFEFDGKNYYLTHGHHVNPEKPKKFLKKTMVLFGHTHVNRVVRVDEDVYVNLASITIPKQNCEKSFAILDESGVHVFNLQNEEIMSCKM